MTVPPRRPPGDLDHRGLPPRPEPDPEVLAVLFAAAEQAWPRPAARTAPNGTPAAHLRWRFSGRWWAQHTVLCRRRPWPGGPPARNSHSELRGP